MLIDPTKPICVTGLLRRSIHYNPYYQKEKDMESRLKKERMKLTKERLVNLIGKIENQNGRQVRELQRQLRVERNAGIKSLDDAKEIDRLQMLLGKYINLTSRLRDEKSNLFKTVKAQSEIIGMLAETADRYNPVDFGNYKESDNAD